MASEMMKQTEEYRQYYTDYNETTTDSRNLANTNYGETNQQETSVLPETFSYHEQMANRGDFMSKFCANINQELLVVKLFYFFFFAAFGSLFPLLGIYFKQLGMNACQTGLLIGFRPFVELFCASLWTNLADKWRRAKQMLLFSLICWIFFTLLMVGIYPSANSCIRLGNDSKMMLVKPWTANSEGNIYISQNRFTLGISPVPLYNNEIENSTGVDLTDLVRPLHTNIVYDSRQVQKVFLLLLILMTISEFFCAPAIALADSATLGYLNNEPSEYGRQRMWGSFGWASSMFIVGISLDYSTIFPSHPCGHSQVGEKNYATCFAAFSLLMICAFVAALRFKFSYDLPIEIQLSDLKKRFGIMHAKIYGGDTCSISGTKASGSVPQINEPIPYPPDATDSTRHHSSYVPRAGAPGTSATTNEWTVVMKMFNTLHYGSLLYVTWFMGFGVGIVFTFLFWHLQDLEGSPALFGIASIINHVSEIGAFFFCRQLIFRLGHLSVLYIGLVGNVVRFLYISYLRNPWWVLPFELLQGLTHAVVWASVCSYITQATPEHLRASAQSILQGIHHGLGRGCGAIIGGIFIYNFGSEKTFRGYGIASFVVLILYFLINYFHQDTTHDLPCDQKVIQEESVLLAPCGVPMNPVSRTMSSFRIDHMDTESSEFFVAEIYMTARFNLYMRESQKSNLFEL